MQNAERSPTGFTFDSAEWLKVYREIDDADEDLLVVYHSHTMTEAYPSRTDIRWSVNTPGASWLLVSTRDSSYDEVRSYRIETSRSPRRRSGSSDPECGADRRLLDDVSNSPHCTLTPGRPLHPMAIEVRLPTILRTYTDGQKAVEGKGDTLAAL